jgi:DNA-binding GntR family transcriptional regulator
MATRGKRRASATTPAPTSATTSVTTFAPTSETTCAVATGPAVDRRMLHEAVAERLRELIVEGVLMPGVHLNERVLCAQLGVSRTPLREALRTLAGEGVVELLPNRGAVVAAMAREDVAHAFEVIAALEALAGELAAARATPAEREAVRALHLEMLAAHARRDLPAYYRLNAAIHRRLVDCARNPVLADAYVRLDARLQALRLRSNLDPRKWDEAVAEHRAMIAALDAGDGARLAAVLRGHLDHKRATVLAQLDAHAPGAPNPAPSVRAAA